MLDLAILGLLKERSMHGYELKKQLGQRLGFFWTVSFGSLYPTLKKLERNGWVAKAAAGDLTTRRKQVYGITEAGEQRFLALLEEGPSSAWEDDKFSLRLAFFRYLRPETRIRLLKRRRDTLVERLREGQRSLSRATRAPEDTYTLSLMRHGMAVTEADIAWLEGLISAEQAAIEQQPGARLRGSTGAPPDAEASAHDPGEHRDEIDRDVEPTATPGDHRSKGAT